MYLEKKRRQKLLLSAMKQRTSLLNCVVVEKIITEHSEELYSNKLENFNKLEKLLERLKVQN
jgi:hypothetical protein